MSMQTWIGTLAVLGAFLFPTISLAQTVTEDSELIREFNASYHINADASVQVTEEIVYDFGTQQRHGLIRSLRTTHAQPSESWWNVRHVKIDTIEVTRNGVPEPFEVMPRSDITDVRIGSPIDYVTGQQTYVISYRLTGALSYFKDDLPELYWNVTGDDWQVPMSLVRVRVTSDQTAGPIACFYGSHGSTNTCSSLATNEMMATLQPSEMTTIVVPDITGVPVVVLEGFNWFTFWSLISVLWLAGFTFRFLYLIYAKWQRIIAEKKTVIVEYGPFEGVDACMTAYFVSKRKLFRTKRSINFMAKMVSAGVVELGEKKFLRVNYSVEADEPVYEFESLRLPDDTLSPCLLRVYKIIFGTVPEVGDKVRLSELNTGIIDLTLDSLSMTAKHELDKRRFGLKKRVRFSVILFTLLANSFSIIMALSLIPDSFSVWAPELMIVSFIFFMILPVVLSHYLTREYQYDEGYILERHLRGLHLYLTVAEEKRIAFHEAPTMAPAQFSTLLPYAIALGVEEKWQALFGHFDINLPWYNGVMNHDFSKSNFAFEKTLTTYVKAAPRIRSPIIIQAFSRRGTGFSSSGSSGGSSFSSGGSRSAGGGGGGGGGRSW